MTLGEFTDHGVQHSNNLEENLLSLHQNNPYFSFSDQEKFLLGLAIWTHDIGNIICRTRHEEYSRELLDTNEHFLFVRNLIGGDLYNCLLLMIESHRSSFDIVNAPDPSFHRNVRTKLMCAIFRLIDDSDITEKRNSEVIFSIIQKYKPMSPQSQRHWDAHREVQSLVFQNLNVEISVKNQYMAQFLLDKFQRTVEAVNQVLVNDYQLSPFTISLVQV